MKRIYSFIALAVMFFGATFNANAEDKQVTFGVNNIEAVTTTTDEGVVFTLTNVTYENNRKVEGHDNIIGEAIWTRDGLWIEKNTKAEISWTVPGKNSELKIKSIQFESRCWDTGHSCDITTVVDGEECGDVTGVDDKKHRVKLCKNNFLDFGAWDDFTLNSDTYDCSYYSFPLERSNDIVLMPNGSLGVNDKVNLYNGGDLCQIKTMVITYEVVIRTATILKKDGWTLPHVAFAGAWTSDEINAVIKSGIYDNGEFSGERLGLVDLTDVARADLGSIETPNPNTIIAKTRNQSIENEANVLVGGNVANLVITDPLTAADAQDAANYSKVNCGFYYEGEAFTATKASYTRPMSSKYATVMIPFSFDPAAQNATIMDVTNVDESGVEVEPTEKKEIEYSRPFITKVYGDALVISAENTTAGGSIGSIVTLGNMIGVYNECELGPGIYYIAEDNFWNSSSCEEEVVLKPFRCCFNLINYNAVKLAIKENATAIKNAQIANEEVPAYNLQGIRVAANAKGFVLMNGKKYFNK